MASADEMANQMCPMRVLARRAPGGPSEAEPGTVPGRGGAQRSRLDGRSVRVVETVYEFGQLVKGTPKSEASKRKIILPELIVPELRRHLDTYSAPGLAGFLFVGIKGGQLRGSNFSKPWARALAKAGLPGDLHVHDLRHTGNTLTAEAGASLGELMNRWATPRHAPRGSIFTPARPANGSSPRRSTGWRGRS